MKRKILQRNAQYGQQVAALLAELTPYDPAILNRRPADGGWSAMQTIYHVLMAEEMTLAYIRKKIALSPDLEDVGFGVYFRAMLLRLSLQSPFKFQAPVHIAADKLPEYATLADTQIRWEQTRAAWTEYLSEIPDTLADKAIYKHPRAGRIGWLQTLGFFDWHLTRHTKQIRRALQ